MRSHLLKLARDMDIPASVVEGLPVEELEATVAQVRAANGYTDGNGDPLPDALLVFYVRSLADRVTP